MSKIFGKIRVRVASKKPNAHGVIRPHIYLSGLFFLILLTIILWQATHADIFSNQASIMLRVVVIHEVIFAVCAPLIVIFIYQLLQSKSHTIKVHWASLLTLIVLWSLTRVSMAINTDLTILIALISECLFWGALFAVSHYSFVSDKNFATKLYLCSLILLLIIDTGMLITGLNESYFSALYISQIGLAILGVMVAVAVICMSFDLNNEFKNNIKSP